MSTEIRHPIFARWFERTAAQIDEQGASQHRATTLAGLSGRVIEVGAGNGLNFRHYPPAVTEVVAIEPEDYLRNRAVDAAADAGVPIEVIDGLADRLPAEEGSFDAAVASLVLCSVDSPERALSEIIRVLRPGGELRFYEHVLADSDGLARLQGGVAWFWPAVGGGCHPNRDTVGAIEDAGFELERCERFSFKPSALAAPVAPHVIGLARKPMIETVSR